MASSIHWGSYTVFPTDTGATAIPSQHNLLKKIEKKKKNIFQDNFLKYYTNKILQLLANIMQIYIFINMYKYIYIFIKYITPKFILGI